MHHIMRTYKYYSNMPFVQIYAVCDVAWKTGSYFHTFECLIKCVLPSRSFLVLAYSPIWFFSPTNKLRAILFKCYLDSAPANTNLVRDVVKTYVHFSGFCYFKRSTLWWWNMNRSGVLVQRNTISSTKEENTVE